MCRLLTLILFILLLLPHPTARATSLSSSNGVMAAYADEAPVAAAQAMLNPQLLRSSGAGYAYYRNFDPYSRDLEETVAGLIRASLDSETAAMYEVANFAADSIQIALNLASLIPVVGNLADLANSGISEARGDHEAAYDYKMSAIPGAGVAYELGQLAGTVYAHAEMAFGNCFVAGTPVLLGDGANSLPIEQLEPGMRVRTAVAGEAQVASTAVEADSWRLVTMQIPNEYGGGGGFVEIRRLMEAAELEALTAEVGGYIYLYIDELQIRGNAKVLALEDCPAIEPGDGRVVIATYTHVNAHIQRLTFEGSDSILEPTAGHPFWSVDLQDYIPAADLAPGDRLLLANGSETTVATNTRQPGQQRVYNIEVEGDHRYFAGDDAVLVHNAYTALSKYLKSKRISSRGMKIFEGGLDNRRNFERLRRANLMGFRNLPGIDKINFSKRLGTSMKTIDLTAVSYNDARTLQRLVRRYVDQLSRFEGDVIRNSRLATKPADIPFLAARRLEIGIPAGKMTAGQRKIFIDEARRAAKKGSNPVEIILFEIGP